MTFLPPSILYDYKFQIVAVIECLERYFFLAFALHQRRFSTNRRAKNASSTYICTVYISVIIVVFFLTSNSIFYLFSLDRYSLETHKKKKGAVILLYLWEMTSRFLYRVFVSSSSCLFRANLIQMILPCTGIKIVSIGIIDHYCPCAHGDTTMTIYRHLNIRFTNKKAHTKFQTTSNIVNKLLDSFLTWYICIVSIIEKP